MNIKSFIIFIFIGSLLAFPGCKTDEKRQLTDWSIPTVKLSPHSKDEKPTPPAEKASAESTANLAHDRLNGHNPTAAIRANDDDPTLRPDPREVAQLNQFEGRQTPDWATGSLPPAPEASAPVPAERIAQNVSNQAIAAESPVTSETSAASAATVASVTNFLDEDLPDSVNSLPSSPSSVASLPASPATSPASAVQPSPQAGSTMTELPGTIGNTVQVSAVTPVPGNASVPAQVQPAVLFMPGNINPKYPTTPKGN